MELRFTRSFEKEFTKIIKGNEQLRKKIIKQLNSLQINPNHPSLRLHKIGSEEFWSISVDKSIRIKMLFKPDGVYVYHVGKHEDIY